MSGNEVIYITVVLPVWNEDKDTIQEIYLRLTRVLINLKREYEIIFIDDGSTNGIFNILREIYAGDNHLKIIRFSKNFGQMAAFLAGFEYARGDIIITMDADLQNAPEDIPKLIEKIDESYEIVGGWRSERRDSFFLRRLSSLFLNRIITIKTHNKLHDWTCSFNAIKKNIIIKFLKDYDKKHLFIKPIIASISDKSIEVKVNHFPRKRKKSRYNLFHLIKLFLDYTLNFSYYFRKANRELFLIQETLE